MIGIVQCFPIDVVVSEPSFLRFQKVFDDCIGKQRGYKKVDRAVGVLQIG